MIAYAPKEHGIKKMQINTELRKKQQILNINYYLK